MSGRGRETTARAGSSRARKDGDRSSLMQQHVAARARRDASPLGSDGFRAAAEELARIEIAIARMEEPPPSVPTKTA